MAADTRDIITLAEAKAALAIGDGDTSKNNVLEGYITAVSRKLDAMVGYVVCGTVTAELHDGGKSTVWLRNQPVYSVTTVVEYDSTVASTLTAESNSSQPTDAYYVNTRNGQIVRRDNGADGLFPIGRENVLVTYVAGRYTTTATVDDRYKEAAYLVLRNLWRSAEASVGNAGEFDVPAQNYPRFTIPNAVKELLADQWRAGSGFAG